MSRKLLFAAVLLLLVSVQALTASCDVRCSMMRASSIRTSADGQASQGHEQMLDCHGMSTEPSNGSNLIAGDSCAATTCGTELKAINKSSDQIDSGSSEPVVSSVALLIDAFVNHASSRNRAAASLSQLDHLRPLAQRPGSSLRI